ncbi:YiiX/YebB-like N1pC/P60 family cysteine hydrolase [Litoreibacter sp.]|nr:YiiX/YebB-like N1pC/P60 family cysteine hydrolase [Litoreibacter sp.]
MDSITTRLGRSMAAYLERPSGDYRPFSLTNQAMLCATLKPGDVLLVEGNSRASKAIKYLTNSTWSHAALYVGEDVDGSLIEADLQQGVIHVPLTKYDNYNTRICRPVGLVQNDLDAVIDHMKQSLGRVYDLKNIVDLARYLMPQPPIPQRYRRRMLEIGSGDPTRAICSSLIAEAFQKVAYPILPSVQTDDTSETAAEILRIRHHSLFTPRDFDLSPYFRIVKPTIERGFNHHDLTWGHLTPPISD